MITCKFHVYCADCDRDGGEQSAIVEIVGTSNYLRVTYPEELCPPDWENVGSPNEVRIVCRYCAEERRD